MMTDELIQRAQRDVVRAVAVIIMVAPWGAAIVQSVDNLEAHYE